MATDQGPRLDALQAQLQGLGYATDSLTQQTSAINAAIRKIVGLRRWGFQEDTLTRSLTLGSSILDLAAETLFAQVDSFNVLDGTERFELDYVDNQTFRHKQWEYQGSTGTPQYWTRYGDELKFTPTTDKVYTAELDLLLLPVVLASAADRAIIPQQYGDAIVWGAVLWLTFRQRDTASYQLAKQEYTDIIRTMISAYPLIQRQSSTHVRRSSHWDQIGGGI